MEDFIGGSAGEFATASAAFRGVLAGVLKGGEAAGVTSGAAKVQGDTSELLGYSFRLQNARDRIVAAPSNTLDLKVAVARFVWMISGNDRLADIAFYEPKVAAFTDDGITVPGSSYGSRMRHAFPGVDQLKGVIQRLKDEPHTRRATISVYQPTDATRESKDIPCTFGLMFHARDGRLHTTTIMRSNNAWGLLPFNLFEFSLLGEVVAAEAGLEVGGFYHFAGSMHIYGRDREKAQRCVEEAEGRSAIMQPMPIEPKPLLEIEKLVRFEASLRHGSTGVRGDTVAEWIDNVRAELHPYWQQLAFILIAAVADRNADRAAIDKVAAVINPELRPFMKWKTQESSSGAAKLVRANHADLFGEGSPSNVVPITRTPLNESLRKLSIEHERRTRQPLGADTVFRLQERFFARAAARNADQPISPEEFEDALADLRPDPSPKS
jgi:thymidylate synthase